MSEQLTTTQYYAIYRYLLVTAREDGAKTVLPESIDELITLTGQLALAHDTLDAHRVPVRRHTVNDAARKADGVLDGEVDVQREANELKRELQDIYVSCGLILAA